MTKRILLAVGAVGLLTLVPAHAQRPQPTFKVEVSIINVDTGVTDADGNRVMGLTVDDFELLEDGQPQKIDTFSHVDIPLTAPPQFAGVDRPVSTDVRTNRDPGSGRVYMLVLDDLNISPPYTAAVREQAREFVDGYLGDGDLAAVAYTSGRTDASQDFTIDRELLVQSIDKFIGRRGRSAALEAADKYYEDRLKFAVDPQTDATDGNATKLAAERQDSRRQVLSGTGPSVDISDFARAQRAITVLDTLSALADSVASVRGRRKAVVMFSEGVDYQLDNPFGMRSVSDVLNATQDMINRAARANVSFYTIDPRGLVGAPADFMQMTGPGVPEGFTASGSTQTAVLGDFKAGQDSLRVLAEETGGFASLNSNSFASAFDRIVEHNSQYYVIGYTPPPHPPDGKFHTIEIRVKRPGLKVTARPGYASPRAATVDEQKRDEAARRAREAKRPDGDTTSTELRNVLGSAMPQRGLNVSVHAAAFRHTDKEASVALAIEIDGQRLPFSPPGTLELSFYGVNEQGRAGVGVRKEINLALKPETIERVKMHGIRLNPRIALAPGRHQLRIGARETSGGESGSVFYDIVVPDFRKEPLTLSGLLVTSVSAQQTPTAEPDAASKQLPGAVTSRREFPVGDTLAIFAEVYHNGPSGAPREIDVAVRVISEAGEEVFNARDTMAARSSEPSSIFAQFALEGLSPGMYLLRVEAQTSGSDAAPIGRETLFAVIP